MPRHPFAGPTGRLVEATLSSAHLDNALGDPPWRRVSVYLPPGHDDDDADYPLLVSLSPFLSSGLKALAWRGWAETLPQQIDRLVAAGEIPPVIVAMPDGFSSLGGTQWIDCPVIGGFDSFLHHTVLPWLEATFRVRPGPLHRAVFGKSSGGYGALRQAMDHAEAWGAVAAHAPDCGFDPLYRRDLPVLCQALARFDGDVDAFVAAQREAERLDERQLTALMLIAMCASYDPPEGPPSAVAFSPSTRSERLGIRLPARWRTGELDAEAWARWTAHDPVERCMRDLPRENLARVKALWIDCGRRDEYFIHFGTRRLHDRLTALGVAHHYEEFDGGHRDLEHRFDRSLPFLLSALTAAETADP